MFASGARLRIGRDVASPRAKAIDATKAPARLRSSTRLSSISSPSNKSFSYLSVKQPKIVRFNNSILFCRQFATGSSKGKNVIDIVKDDHKKVDALFETMLGSGSEQSKQEALNETVISLSEHSVAEEVLLYPAIRKAGNNAPQLVDHALDEHQTAKDLLEKIRKMKPSDSDFPATLKELVEGVRHHVKEEESTILPLLQRIISDEDLVTMGEHFNYAKKVAPPVPHPGAPNKPPFNVVMAPISTFLDKIKQVVKGEDSGAQA